MEINEGPLTLVYREEERHRALGRDATFSWSRALTHPPRCNRTRHRDRHLVSDFVGPPPWISRRGGRHLGPEVMGAAILDRKCGGRHLGSDVVTSLTLNRHLYYFYPLNGNHVHHAYAKSASFSTTLKPSRTA